MTQDWIFKVTHLRKGIFTADVHVDVTMYPFDEQKLTLIFDSPGYPQKDVELRVSKQSVHSDVDEVNVFQITVKFVSFIT